MNNLNNSLDIVYCNDIDLVKGIIADRKKIGWSFTIMMPDKDRFVLYFRKG
jgi:hypothetical protein